MLIYDINNFEIKENDNFILGAFESFHMGHFQLLKTIHANKGRKIIVCFNNEDLMPKFGKSFFTDNFAKYTNFATLGFDAVVELNFKDISLMDGKDFLINLFKDAPINLVVGKDFRFGKGAQYKAEDIKNILTNANVTIVDLYKIQNVKISTKDLKDLLEFGEVDKLNLLLPKNYSFSGLFKDPNLIETSKELAQLHSGIYCVLIKTHLMVYYGLLHHNLSSQKEITLIDTPMKFNQNQRLLVEVLSLQRLIISQNEDKIKDSDLHEGKSYFLKNKNLI
ncbi:FAD synthase [Mycoplasmopsis columboralis]|uniref:FAD synthase n=1 Tax=Mycoplasmopsis columboralis TaxID=171282 RepID=A0A449B6D8_9BACT|nr:hypothetical protein [Mycoplasmopsis columboralis]VEU76164.1 riboflavin kinase [Mycoplasmopsis columboralis]